jgi:hypothetical protein
MQSFSNGAIRLHVYEIIRPPRLTGMPNTYWNREALPAPANIQLFSLAAATNGAERLEIFACDGIHGVWHASELSKGNWSQTNGSVWTLFDTSSGPLFPNQIAVTVDSQSRIWVFAIDSAGSLWQIYQLARAVAGQVTQWSPWFQVPQPGVTLTTLHGLSALNGLSSLVAQNLDGMLVVSSIGILANETQGVYSYYQVPAGSQYAYTDPSGAGWFPNFVNLPSQPGQPLSLSVAKDYQGLNLLLLTSTPTGYYFYISTMTVPTGGFSAFAPIPSDPAVVILGGPNNPGPLPYPEGAPTIGAMSNGLNGPGFFFVDSTESLYLLKPTLVREFPSRSPSLQFEYERQLAPSSCRYFNQLGPLAVSLTSIFQQGPESQLVFFTDPAGTTLLALHYSFGFAPALSVGTNLGPVYSIAQAITIDHAQNQEFTPIGQLAVTTNEDSGIVVFGFTVQSNNVYCWRQI